MNKRLLLLVLTCFALHAVALTSPGSAQVPKGDRIRLEVDPVGKIDGQFVTSDDRSVTIQSRHSTLQIDRAKIERVQRYQGERRAWKPGMLIGGGIGLTFGLLIEFIAASESDSANGGAVVSCVILGGGAGALIGGLFKGDEWKTIPLENLTVSAGTDRSRNFTLALTASF